MILALPVGFECLGVDWMLIANFAFLARGHTDTNLVGETASEGTLNSERVA